MKIFKILDEIKKLDINIEEIIIIKQINCLVSSFETYLIILSQRTRNENKLPNLSSFLLNLKGKKRQIK